MRVGCSLIGILIVIVILGVASALTLSALGGNPTTTMTGIAALTTTTIENTTAVTSKEATVPTTAARSGGIPSQAAAAACQADASTVENAVVDYSTAHGIPATAVTIALLKSGPSPFVSSIPTSPDFRISIVSGAVMVAAPPSAPAVPYLAAGACSKA